MRNFTLRLTFNYNLPNAQFHKTESQACDLVAVFVDEQHQRRVQHLVIHLVKMHFAYFTEKTTIFK